MDAAPDVAARFARFARDEAPGRSALYAQWAAGVAADGDMCALLATIPATHRQPPLIFAVSRMLGAPEEQYPEWAMWVRTHASAVVDECSRRSLQTNEPLRCAALLPALADIAGPLALLEIGASAGLCLYPDRYSYRYAPGPDLDPANAVSPVVLHSAYRGDGPGLRLPEVVWRAGIDVAPLDAADPADRGFLTSLVWPGEQGRVERIEAALDLVAADPPVLVAGDATAPGVLEGVAALAPVGATLVVTLPGVLPHIPRAGRERIFEALGELGVRWVSMEPPAAIDAEAGRDRWNGFVLRRDGRVLAAVDPLGAFVEWRADREGIRG